MSRQRRNWTPEEKAAIVLEIIREEGTLAEISRKYDIPQPVLSHWRSEFIENMATVFDKKGESIDKVKEEYESEKERLVKKIGELTLDVDFFKKKHKQVDIEGKKDVLGFWLSEEESSRHWLQILEEIEQRGVEDILFISLDCLTGLEKATQYHNTKMYCSSYAQCYTLYRTKKVV